MAASGCREDALAQRPGPESTGPPPQRLRTPPPAREAQFLHSSLTISGLRPLCPQGIFKCGLFVGPGSRVQTLPRLRAAVSTRTTHTIRKTMPCRRPQSPETQPGALLALRTGLRKIAPLRAQNASKAAQLTCSNDTPRRNDTTCTARLASLGPSTGQPAIRECTLRPELATRAVLRPGRLQAVVAEKAVGLGLPRASCDTACNIQEVCDPERTLEEARA